MMERRNRPPYGSLLITGASSGIGAALAQYYAAEGIYLALSGRDLTRLEFVAEACRKKGAYVSTKGIDVTNEQEMALWVEDCDRQAPLDLLVANAGISGGAGGSATSLEQESFSQARLIFKTNLEGALNTIAPILPRMVERGKGQVALMSSLAGYSGLRGAPAYSASKGAVRLYGLSLRAAYAPNGIRVNVICPGFVRSRITDSNTFPMPFFMEAEKAALFIAQGLEKNRAEIAFPWPMVAATKVFSLLPETLKALIQIWLPRKKKL